MDVKELQQKISRREEKILSLEKEKASLEGKQSAIQEQLQKDFGCKTVEEAEALLKTKDAEIKKLEEERDVIVTDLEKCLTDNE